MTNRKRSLFAALTIAFCSTPLTACLPRTSRTTSETKPSPTVNSASGPLVAFIFEGQIWTVSSDGSNRRMLEVGEESIDEFLWSDDGKLLYLAVGLRLVSVSISDGAKKEIGVIAAPAGTTIDRLQNSRSPGVIIIHASDANALPHIFSYSVTSHETRELTVDEYSALTMVQSPSVRGFADLSVSPDVTRVLFKTAIGPSEQLFVANLEHGAALQITSLGELAGFEESAELEGGRRIIEAEWSPDSRFILFNPAQSCSDSGLCYGQLFLADALTGAQRQLSSGMVVGLDVSWDSSGTNLLFEDAGNIMFTATATGATRLLAEGNRAKWQPIK